MSVYVWENVARLWKCVCGGFVRERGSSRRACGRLCKSWRACGGSCVARAGAHRAYILISAFGIASITSSGITDNVPSCPSHIFAAKPCAKTPRTHAF